MSSQYSWFLALSDEQRRSLVETLHIAKEEVVQAKELGSLAQEVENLISNLSKDLAKARGLTLKACQSFANIPHTEQVQRLQAAEQALKPIDTRIQEIKQKIKELEREEEQNLRLSTLLEYNVQKWEKFYQELKKILRVGNNT